MSSRYCPVLVVIILLMAPSWCAWNTAQPPPSGNWTITTHESHIGQNYTVNGNIIITAGGRLELINSTVTMNCTGNGQFGIDVGAGGELALNNTTVTSSTTDIYYQFHIYGKAEIRNSTIERAWHDSQAATPRGGIEILSNDVIIDHSRVRNCQRYDIYINYPTHSGSEAIVQYCNISDSAYGIKVECGEAPWIISNNITDQNVTGLLVMGNSSPHIKENLIWNCSSGIQIADMARPLIEGNEISNITLNGILNAYTSEAEIRSNNISECRIGIANIHMCRPAIYLNSITNNSECGIVNNVANTTWDNSPDITYNNITCDSNSGQISPLGIQNQNESNPRIVDNDISRFVTGIDNIHSSGAYIRGNNIFCNSYAGIKNWNSSKPFINANNITFNKNFGLFNENNSTAAICANRIMNSNIGINNVAYSISNITNNIIANGSIGIRSQDCSSSDISNNHVTNFTHGIVGEGSSILNLTDNDIFSNIQFGIMLTYNTSSNINGNLISRNMEGIESNGTSRIDASFNTIFDNNIGIKCTDSSFLSADNNTIRDNVNDAMSGDTRSTIISGDNLMANNRNGISCTGDCDITSCNDVLSSNGCGVVLSSRRGGKISGSTIVGGNYGISVSSCSPQITDVEITDAGCGIYYANSSAPTNIADIRINPYDHVKEGNKYSFICEYSSAPSISNSTVIADFSYCGDLLVRSDSHPEILNCSINHSRLFVYDSSSLTEFDYLRAHVKDSKDRALGNATVMFNGISYHGPRSYDSTTDLAGNIFQIIMENATYLSEKLTVPVLYNVTVIEDGDAYNPPVLLVGHNTSHDIRFDFKPTVNQIHDLQLVEDLESQMDLTAYIFDRDHKTSELQINLSGGTELNKNVMLINHTVLSLYYSNPVDSETISFTVDDGLRIAEGNVTVHVTPIDDPIIFNGSTELNVTEDEESTIPLLPSIHDDDDSHSWIDISIQGISKYARIDKEWNLILNYSDELTSDRLEILIKNEHSSLLVRFNITIRPSNDAPVITHWPIINPTEGIADVVDFTNYSYDPDLPPNTLCITTNSRYCECKGLVLRFLYPEGIKTDNITITINDGNASTSYSVVINVIPFDDPPVLNWTFPINVIAGKHYEYDLNNSVYDPDTPKWKIKISTESPFITVKEFRILLDYPKDWANDNETVVLNLSDGNSTTSWPIYINITKLKSPFPPIIDVYLYILVPIAIIAGAAAIITYRRIRYGWYDVKRAFLVYTDGRMLAHYGKGPQSHDDMLVSSMLTAVQQFIEEVMMKDKAGSIKEFQYEDMKIALEKGDKIYLAVFLKGYATEELRKQMKDILSQIERKHRQGIAEWDGRMTDNEFIAEAERKLNSLTKTR